MMAISRSARRRAILFVEPRHLADDGDGAIGAIRPAVRRPDKADHACAGEPLVDGPVNQADLERSRDDGAGHALAFRGFDIEEEVGEGPDQPAVADNLAEAWLQLERGDLVTLLDRRDIERGRQASSPSRAWEASYCIMLRALTATRAPDASRNCVSERKSRL